MLTPSDNQLRVRVWATWQNLWSEFWWIARVVHFIPEIGREQCGYIKKQTLEQGM